MVNVLCQRCNGEYEAKRRDAKWCPTCQPIKRKEYAAKTEAKRRRPNTCLSCGKPTSRRRNYCRHCARLAERNNSWKGGRYKGFHGYVYLYMPEHPRANKYHNRYVAEHVLVWEKAHGESLPEGYIVHHLNGIKDDNRPENLVALQPKHHSTRTRLEIAEQRIRELEQQLRELRR